MSGSKVPEEATSSDKNELFLPVEYQNELPEVMFDVKRFPYPYSLDAYMGYKVATFAKHYKNENVLDCNHQLDIDFMNIEKYETSDAEVQLPEEDLRLLTDTKTESNVEQIKHFTNSKNVSWLRKAEYITADYSKGSKRVEPFDKTLTLNAQNYQLSADNLKSVEYQKDAIKQTFEDAKADPKIHIKKPTKAEPVEILPLFPKSDVPDKCSCAFVSFDNHMISHNDSTLTADSEMKNGILRYMKDEYGDYFGYYLPKKLELPLKKTDAKQFQLMREYNENLNTNASQAHEDVYVISEDTETKKMIYAPLSSKLKLVKRIVNKDFEYGNDTSDTLLVTNARSS